MLRSRSALKHLTIKLGVYNFSHSHLISCLIAKLFQDPLSSGFNASFRVVTCCPDGTECRVSDSECDCVVCTAEDDGEVTGGVLGDTTTCLNNCSGGQLRRKQ